MGTVNGGFFDEEEPAPNLLAGLRSFDWLDQQDFPPLSWVVPGLIPEGASLLVGGPKIGKSWLTLSIAMAVASGGAVLGKVWTGAPRDVLLLALEDGDRRLQWRARKLNQGIPLPPRVTYLTRVQPNLIVATITQWLETLAPSPQPLVILDTLGKIMPPALSGETAYQRDYKVAGRLKAICDDRPGMALVIVHHDRKAASEDFVDSVSGTNGIAGACDTIVIVSRPRTEERGLLKVTGRDVVEREYAVRCSDGLWTLVGDDLDEASREAEAYRATSGLGDRSTEILLYVNENPGGVRRGDVAAKFGIPGAEAGTYLARLAEANKIHRAGRGLYVPVTSVTSVTSDDETDENVTLVTDITLVSGDPDCDACRSAGVACLDHYMPKADQ